MARPDILNLPIIAAKLAKLQAAHTETEALMDRWNAEAKEIKHGKARRKPRHARGRKQENITVTSRGHEAQAVSSNGAVDETGGETDQERWLRSSKEIDDKTFDEVLAAYKNFPVKGL